MTTAKLVERARDERIAGDVEGALGAQRDPRFLEPVGWLPTSWNRGEARSTHLDARSAMATENGPRWGLKGGTSKLR